MRRYVLATITVLAAILGFGLQSSQAAELADEFGLVTVIREAKQIHTAFTDQIADYTCTLVKPRERINGQLMGHEYAEVKLRHHQARNGQIVVPFSVYMKFLAPADLQGREVIYVEGQNDGKAIARRGGKRFAYVTVAIDPFGELAMERNRYPITHIGIQSLIEELLLVGEEELQNPHEELQCRQLDGIKIDSRLCRMFEFTHPVRRDRYRYHVAQIFVDQELNLPIRHASYDWPDEEGGKPKLLEEYTYLNLKLNVGLTDWDFDHRNESYQFLKTFKP